MVQNVRDNAQLVVVTLAPWFEILDQSSLRVAPLSRAVCHTPGEAARQTVILHALVVADELVPFREHLANRAEVLLCVLRDRYRGKLNGTRGG